MSYFNDFAAGYQMTSGKRERDRDRADKLDQERLRREFELDKDVERYKQDDIARRAGYDNQTNQRVGAADAAREAAERGYEFTGGEGEKGRTFTAGEGEKGRTFTAAQSTADRDLRQKLQTDTLNQAAQQFGKTQDYNYANMGLMAGLNARKEDARTDPLSLTNQLNNEKLIKLKAENANAGPLPGGKATPLELTPKDREALTWARANPYDAQATKILDRLKLAK
jgi:hypothetical protein